MSADQMGTASTFGPSGTGSAGTGPTHRTVTAAELDEVFDDPNHGDPGMDRMRVHLLWELVLLVGVAGLGVLFWRTHGDGVTGANLRAMLLAAASLGFLTIGLGLSLRAGAVNLAVGPIAAGAELFFATHSDRGLLPTMGMALLLAGGIGVLIGLAVVVPHVPPWAASLAGAFGVVVWIQKHSGSTTVTVGYHADKHAYYWYAGFIATALLGGILGLVKPIRRGLGRYRPVHDPATRRGRGAALSAFLAIVASSVFAGLAGLLAAVSTSVVTPRDGLLDTGLALGAALAAGTSVYGRRGGVFGTVLSVGLLVLVMRYGVAAGLRISPYAVAAVAILGGLLVTRLVERYGRPISSHTEAAGDDDPRDGWSRHGRTDLSRTDLSRTDPGRAGPDRPEPGYPPTDRAEPAQFGRSESSRPPDDWTGRGWAERGWTDRGWARDDLAEERAEREPGGPMPTRSTEPAAGWPAHRSGDWASQLPARPTDDTWGGAADDRWGIT